MASKIANSGLSLSLIILAFKRGGLQGLENLLSEICENSKVDQRVTKSKRIIQSLSQYMHSLEEQYSCSFSKSCKMYTVIIFITFLYSQILFLYEGTKVHLYWYNFLCVFFKGSGGHIIIQIVV